MSLQPQEIPAVPADTREVAEAAFPKGNRYMTMRDELGTFYHDLDFVELYGVRGKPGNAPWRLALVSLFQYVEGLSDQQAVEGVRSRIDWKYALSMELKDTGFDASVLSEFRTRLVTGSVEMRILDKMLERFNELGHLRSRGRQRTDSTHVLASVRAVNRLVMVGETMRHALNVLADCAGEWLKPHIEPEWIERYERRFDDYRLPKEKAERQQLAAQIGADGRTLLTHLSASKSPAWLRKIDAVRILHRVWLEQYMAVAPDVPMQWRETKDQPPSSQRIHSPYDPDAKYAGKRTTTWLGYKAHLTENCDDDKPHLITHVITTPATTPDFDIPERLHRELAAKELLPAEHLLDAGYVDSELLVASETEYKIDVIGPVGPDHSWQALTPDGLDVSAFVIDWDARRITCPQGEQSQKWSQTHDRLGNPIINIRFSPSACASCPLRQQCTRSATGPRNMTVRPRLQHEALQRRRQEQNGAEFQRRYAARAGIEGTISHAVRTTPLRRSRYVGLAKTHLQNIFSAAALNLCRIVDWLSARTRASTRTSTFAKLALA